jgi:NAD(P)-dependent dehydrogenase (short-subunit alcohol dehydrogenase family)
MNPSYDFHGQVALVTGASSGMGLATARAFAEAGATVVLADLKAEAVGAAAQDLVAAGHTAIAVTCDVSDDAAVAGMVDRTHCQVVGPKRTRNHAARLSSSSHRHLDARLLPPHPEGFGTGTPVLHSGHQVSPQTEVAVDHGVG